MINADNNLQILETMLNDKNNDKDVKVKKLQYKMDFGTTEIVVKMGLN